MSSQSKSPGLIVFSGLPGTGKSTVARGLAKKISAVWLRIDSIEQAIRNASILRGDVEDAGYIVGHAVAADNLRAGLTVIADCVNDWMLTRDGWRAVGLAARARVFEVEIVCSDKAEHRRRVEKCEIDIVGLDRPTWDEIIHRDYHDWTRAPLVIDTVSADVATCIRIIQEYVSG